MCDRDDCTSLLNRRIGQTIICAWLVEIDPPTLRDQTGTYTLKSPLPSGAAFGVEQNDLYLFHLKLDGDKERCTRLTPIPGLLYPVYRKILEDYRLRRMNATKKT